MGKIIWPPTHLGSSDSDLIFDLRWQRLNVLRLGGDLRQVATQLLHHLYAVLLRVVILEVAHHQRHDLLRQFLGHALRHHQLRHVRLQMRRGSGRGTP